MITQRATDDALIEDIKDLLTTIDADTSILSVVDFATSAKQDAIIAAIGSIPGGGGTQYTEGDTDASITGTVAMMEVAANTLQPLQGTVADGLLVNLGSNNDITGTVTANAGTNLNTSALALESGGNLATIAGAVSGSEIQVDIVGITPDLMLGTDFSAVFGVNTLLTTTQADSRVNTTDAFTVNAWGQYFNGTTWDRMRGDATDGLLVNLGSNNDITGTVTAELSAVDNAVLDQIETNQDTQTAILTTIDTDTGAILADTNAIKTAVEIIDNAISGSEMQVDVVTIPDTSIEASASVIGSDMHFDADGDNTAQQVKASAGRIYAIEVSNPNSADAYLQLFDVANGSITVGTTPPNLSLFVPAGDGTKDGAMDKFFTVPIQFGTAINYACTTTATGSIDPTTGLIVNILYK